MVFLALARYLSRDQLHRLIFAGRSRQTADLRLKKLAGLDGAARESPQYLRQLSMSGSAGQQTQVWALTTHGYRIAEARVRSALVQPAKELRPEAIARQVALNEVLVRLVERVGGRSGAGGHFLPTSPRLGWDSAQHLRLPSAAGPGGEQFVTPDALLELRLERGRVFVEWLGGQRSLPQLSQSIADTTSRYARFVSGVAEGDRSAYLRAFPDGWRAEVLFIAEGVGRASLLGDAWSGRSLPTGLTVRVLDEAEAAEALASRALGQLGAQPELPQILAVARAPESDAVGAWCRQALDELKRVRAEVLAHNDRAGEAGSLRVPDVPELPAVLAHLLPDRSGEGR